MRNQPANIINHFFLLVDESLSMRHLRDTTIRVFDAFIARLAPADEGGADGDPRGP
jgi:nitric oxide reductase activation protein